MTPVRPLLLLAGALLAALLLAGDPLPATACPACVPMEDVFRVPHPRAAEVAAALGRAREEGRLVGLFDAHDRRLPRLERFVAALGRGLAEGVVVQLVLVDADLAPRFRLARAGPSVLPPDWRPEGESWVTVVTGEAVVEALVAGAWSESEAAAAGVFVVEDPMGERAAAWAQAVRFPASGRTREAPWELAALLVAVVAAALVRVRARRRPLR